MLIVIPERLRSLQARATSIRGRWETLVRIEPVSSPLANPDALAYLIPWTLEQVFKLLAEPAPAPVSTMAAKVPVPRCECGHNPYLAYFSAAEQALVESSVLLEAELPPGKRCHSDVAEVMRAVRRIARREIDTFCGACVHRGVDAKCRYPAATAERT